MAAGTQDDGVCQVGRSLPGSEVEGQHPKANAVTDQQAGHVLVFQNRDVQLVNLAGQRLDDGTPGVIARVAGTAVFVGSEKALIELALRRAGETAAPGGKLLHRLRRLTGHQLDDARVRQVIAFPQRVGEMLLPRVLGITRAQSGIDTASGEYGVSVKALPLPNDQGFDACLMGGNGRAAPPPRSR